jgi:1A family penicillin-binding protein
MLAFVACAALVSAFLLLGYGLIARDLPAPAELRQRASSFQTTRIYDRAGNLLNEAFDPNMGRRTEVTLGEISPALIDATIATEDANFFRHPGIDPVALARALYYAVQERDVVAGGSTITQQLVKRVMLSSERTVTRKVKEAILAAEITRRYTKEEILELYLNEVYYGNFSYGIDAAAETYFAKEAANLSLAEAALLAGLPQAPAYYDPYTHPDRAKARQGVVLGLMLEAGYITAAEADAAWAEPFAYRPLQFDLKAPHFTLYVRQQLEQLFGPEALYQSGLSVYTTLDPVLQAEAERTVKEQIAALAGRNVSNGALVAMRPDSGEVVALVGSVDFDDVEIDGQVNMALAPRQPGSSIKPFVYLADMELPDRPRNEHWTPGTLVADITTAFPDGANPPYVPSNYDGKEMGLVTVRQALANSRNIPAVAALQTATLPHFLDLMGRLGVTTLTRPDYGLSLALGAGEIPLLEMTNAFGVLANGGRRVPPVTMQKIMDSQGNPLCEQGTSRPCQPGAESAQQVVNPVDAFLITDILSDNQARTPVFGANSVLRLPERPAAVKTGTTNDFRDNLTIGFTPQLVTGVWVGNADNSPMQDVSGVAGAGPIWNQFMQVAHAGQPVAEFAPLPGVRLFEVCSDTGTAPSEVCPERRAWYFADDRPPLPREGDLWQKVRMVRGAEEVASEFTPPDQVEERVYKIYPPQYREWALQHGIAQPPPGVFATPAPEQGPSELAITSPGEGATVGGVVPVFGSASVPGFASFELQYGISHDPGAFSLPIAGPFGAPLVNGQLGTWDTTQLENGPHTLRVLVRDQRGQQYEARVRLWVENRAAAEPPTGTPTDLPSESTATWTLEPPTPTWTVEAPVLTEVPTETPTSTLEPPTPTWTAEPPVPSETPTWMPEATQAVDAGEVPTMPAPAPDAASGETPKTDAAIDAVLPTAPAEGSGSAGSDLVPVPNQTPSDQ